MIDEVFHTLGIKAYSTKLNNRKILKGITEVIGVPGRENTFATAIDKLDKAGRERVFGELASEGFEASALEKLIPFMELKGTNEEKLEALSRLLAESKPGMEGIAELREIMMNIKHMGHEDDHIEVDVTLARGLNYYTGTIFEVKALNSGITGSLSGGGRYDNLTGVFGLEGVSGVGFSFGVDRIYDVMEELHAFPEEDLVSTKVMIVNFDADSAVHGLGLLSKLRGAGISSEIYPDSAKLKKQMSYANKKGIPYVLLAGTREIEEKIYGLKDMKTGTQRKLSFQEILQVVAG
jgi:histidyl-tRNA synthetase